MFMAYLTARRGRFWRNHYQKIIAVLIWLVLLGGYALYYQLSGLTLEVSLYQLLALFDTPYGPLLYLFSFLIRPFLFFSVGILCIMGGIIFGTGSLANLLLALVYAVAGVICSGLISFSIGRFLGRGIVPQWNGIQTAMVQRYAARLRRNGFLTVLTMRLILLPFDVVNYLAALMAVEWKSFLLATAIGVVPSTFAFVSFGAAIDISQITAGQMPQIDIKMILLAILLFGGSLFISRWYKQHTP